MVGIGAVFTLARFSEAFLVLRASQLGVTLWGVHRGMTQGPLAALVADTAPADLRGTALGFFNLLSGLAMLAATVIAGLLWDAFGSARTFQAGAVFAALTLLALLLRSRTATPR